jgi:hypothetical protein
VGIAGWESSIGLPRAHNAQSLLAHCAAVTIRHRMVNEREDKPWAGRAA